MFVVRPVVVLCPFVPVVRPVVVVLCPSVPSSVLSVPSVRPSDRRRTSSQAANPGPHANFRKKSSKPEPYGDGSINFGIYVKIAAESLGQI